MTINCESSGRINYITVYLAKKIESVLHDGVGKCPDYRFVEFERELDTIDAINSKQIMALYCNKLL